MPLKKAVFELRVYHTAEGRLPALLARFRDHTVGPSDSSATKSRGHQDTLRLRSHSSAPKRGPWHFGGRAGEGAARQRGELLETYLRRNYAAQPLLNQIYIYWASANAPELLSGTERKELLKKIQSLQQPDGGWNLASLDKLERSDKTEQATGSDGFATALVALALEANPPGGRDQSLERGLAWLAANQGSDGRWQAFSLNKQRDPESNIGKFMSDAATGYAVLALEQAR